MRRGHRVAVAAVLLAFGSCSDPPAGYDQPAAVCYDAQADVCLVANVQGEPLAKDGDGYIARVHAGGRMWRHWIHGGVRGATLHAPKGMALVGELLWVADIDVLRAFDRRSGAALGDVAIPGATSLWGVAAAPDGTIYCTDTGLDGAGVATGTDAVWQLHGTKFPPAAPPAVLLRDAGLGHPTGIVAREASVYVVNWRDGQFFSIDGKGRRTDLMRAPAAQLDGLVRVLGADDRPVWYATSRAGRCVYRFDAGGGCAPLPGSFEQPGACDFDLERRQLVVPLFAADRLERVAP